MISDPSHDHGRHDRHDRYDRYDREPMRERDSYQPERRDRESAFGGERVGPAFVSASELQFATPQEAEAAFMKVLRQIKVQPDWEWTQAIRAGIKDPNWRAIPEPEKRKEAFMKYCEDLRSQEKHKEQERQTKLRTDFTAMLRSHPEIKHYTRWKTALPILEGETIFRSAKDDDERRQLFVEYITSLSNAHDERLKEERSFALDQLATLLSTLNLEPFTRWCDAEEQLERNKEFKTEKFKSLYRIDVLSTFEKHIRQLQKEHNDRVQAERRDKYRIERKNREAFVELLKELQKDGNLKAGTKWKDIHSIIQDDPRYNAMLGQSGSSPLDLFFDVLEHEEQNFRLLRRHALEVLSVRNLDISYSDILTSIQDKRYEVTTATPYQDFVDVMRNDKRTADIDDDKMRGIFDYIVAKVKRRENEEQHRQDDKDRVAMDEFRHALRATDPPITPSDTWETVRARVEDTKEYRALKSDSLRQSTFDKYLRRLKEKDKERESDRRDRSRRDTRDREKDRDRDRRDRDREYRNGHPESHRRHRTRTRSPEQDSYAAERRQAQQDREARYRNHDSTGLSPPYRRDRERDGDRYERSRQGSGDHYGRERREREAERERSYITRGDPLSRADPRETSVSELDYGDSGGRPTSTRRRRESDESTTRRDNKV